MKKQRKLSANIATSVFTTVIFASGCGGGSSDTSNNAASNGSPTVSPDFQTELTGDCPCEANIQRLSTVMYDGNFELNTTPVFTYTDDGENRSCSLAQPDGTFNNFISVSGDDTGGFCTGQLNGEIISNGGVALATGAQTEACYMQLEQLSQSWNAEGRLIAYSEFDQQGAGLTPVSNNTQLQCF